MCGRVTKECCAGLTSDLRGGAWKNNKGFLAATEKCPCNPFTLFGPRRGLWLHLRGGPGLVLVTFPVPSFASESGKGEPELDDTWRSVVLQPGAAGALLHLESCFVSYPSLGCLKDASSWEDLAVQGVCQPLQGLGCPSHVLNALERLQTSHKTTGLQRARHVASGLSCAGPSYCVAR